MKSSSLRENETTINKCHNLKSNNNKSNAERKNYLVGILVDNIGPDFETLDLLLL
jgi:hypothetical protein